MRTTTITQNSSKRFKKLAIIISAIVLVLAFTACGESDLIYGTFAGEDSSENAVVIDIKEDGSITYKKNDREPYPGKWTKVSDKEITASFYGEVSSKCEPITITVSEDGQTITVASEDPRWTTDYYDKVE